MVIGRGKGTEGGRRLVFVQGSGLFTIFWWWEKMRARGLGIVAIVARGTTTYVEKTVSANL